MTGVSGGESGAEQKRLHVVQPQRDLEANWEVDLAKKLEDYLLKICSGEISGSVEDDGHSPVNFAEAALLLQGSVQVYSRKVEYLYSLVLHTLEFLSQRQQDQGEGTSEQPEKSASHTASGEENDNFWVFDDVPVEAKNSLDSSVNKENLLNHFVKPPANLVVLEGDCLDTSGDGNELESYLLATNDLYQDFILLDPCDAVVVDDYLKGDGADKRQYGTYRTNSARKSLLSPSRRSGGTAQKSFHGKNQDANANANLSPRFDRNFETNDCDMGSDPTNCNNPEDFGRGFDMDDRHSEPEDLDDSDEDDDPWKPLNPHEPGNLRVKPFKKVKAFRRNGLDSKRSTSISTIFPLARLHGVISPELTKIWESRQKIFDGQSNQSPTLYEKLRQLLTDPVTGVYKDFTNLNEGNENNEFDGGPPDFDDVAEDINMEEDAAFHHDMHDNAAAHFGTDEGFDNGDPHSPTSLEDLCRSHLDALLASIAENEKQTELAARVSSWKQKIEQNLEEQEAHRPFDIREYGESIIEKLSVSLVPDNENVTPFTDVVKGQEKHDVARTFSALLQLVNNGDVLLNKTGAQSESVCYSAVNPFHIQLLNHEMRRLKTPFKMPKKRCKSPVIKKSTKRDKPAETKSPATDSASEYASTINCKVSAKLGSVGNVRCTPEGKRRRRSRLIQPVD